MFYFVLLHLVTIKINTYKCNAEIHILFRYIKYLATILLINIPHFTRHILSYFTRYKYQIED